MPLTTYPFQLIYSDDAAIGGFGKKYKNVSRLGMNSTRFQFTGRLGERVQVRAIKYFVTLAAANADIVLKEAIQEECIISDVLNDSSFQVLIFEIKGSVRKIGKVDILGVDYFRRIEYIIDLQRTATWTG